MTTKDTSVQSSMTTAKEIKKPTVRHILQKEGSFSQSDVLGKGTQVPSTAEQREWRPYDHSRLPSCVLLVCRLEDGGFEGGSRAYRAIADPSRHGDTRNRHHRACACQSLILSCV